jgi:hypothetical protein
MSNKIFEPDDELENDTIVFERIEYPVVRSNAEDRKVDVSVDYTVARQTLRDNLLTGQKALDIAMSHAQGSESARSIEVMSGLIKTVNDTSIQLFELQERVAKAMGEDKKLTTETKVDGQVNVQMSTSEILKYLEDMNKLKEVTNAEEVTDA